MYEYFHEQALRHIAMLSLLSLTLILKFSRCHVLVGRFPCWIVLSLLENDARIVIRIRRLDIVPNTNKCNGKSDKDTNTSLPDHGPLFLDSCLNHGNVVINDAVIAVVTTVDELGITLKAVCHGGGNSSAVLDTVVV